MLYLNFMCSDHISGINDLIERMKPLKQTLDYNDISRVYHNYSDDFRNELKFIG